MTYSTLKRAIIAITLAILIPSLAHAGTTGMITGTVRDTSGVPIAGAHVAITAPSDRETATTDACGNFSFLRLPPDVYAISIDKGGYASVAYARVSVFADNTMALAFRMFKPLITITDRFIPDRYVRRGVGGDMTDLRMTEFHDFQNPVATSLSTVPGVVLGSGGGFVH